MRMMDDALAFGAPPEYYAGAKMATSTTSARHGGRVHGGLVSI